MLKSTTSQPGFVEEITRQRDILDRERLSRAISTTTALAVSGFFLPLTFVLAGVVINLVIEYLLYRLQSVPERLVEPKRYWTLLGLVFLLEVNFVLPPAILWHMPGAYVKAYAVGVMSGAMLHVVGLRSIHFPMGLAAGAAILIFSLASNTILWVGLGDYPSLAVSTLCIAISTAYFFSSVLWNHRLHRDAARLRAEAEAANAAKGRFLAQMSHELRTPLNGILGMGRALRHTADGPAEEAASEANAKETRERLEMMITSAEGLSAILDDILDMTAVDAGNMPIRPCPASPREEVTRIVALFQQRAAEAGLHLSLTVDPAIQQQVVFDPQRVRQCLSNLLTNAIKFTDSGSVRVELSPTQTAEGRPGLRIDVADTGPGIKPDQEELIFKPFIKGTTDQPKSGNGLGLSISRALARRMGGELALVNDDVHSGARFRLTVAVSPAPASSEHSDRAHAGAAGIPGQPTPKLEGLHALIVDDIATNRMVAAAYLSALGVTSTQVSGGEAALDKLRRTSFDLVLLDINMPAPDGLETLRRIRLLPGTIASIPTIAMTADAMEEKKRAYLAAGLDGYIAKPIGTEGLRAELIRVLTLTAGAKVARRA